MVKVRADDDDSSLSTESNDSVEDGQYHHSLGLPDIEYPDPLVKPVHATRHALNEADSKKYQPFVLPDFVAFKGLEAAFRWDMENEKKIESGSYSTVRVKDGKPVKISPRVSYNDEYDITIVTHLDPKYELVSNYNAGDYNEEPAVIITAWLNPKWDYPEPTEDFITPETHVFKSEGKL